MKHLPDCEGMMSVYLNHLDSKEEGQGEGDDDDQDGEDGQEVSADPGTVITT
jgi:hypothetical protein